MFPVMSPETRGGLGGLSTDIADSVPISLSVAIAPTASLPYSITDDSMPQIYIAALSALKLKCRQYQQHNDGFLHTRTRIPNDVPKHLALPNESIRSNF